MKYITIKDNSIFILFFYIVSFILIIFVFFYFRIVYRYNIGEETPSYRSSHTGGLDKGSPLSYELI